MLWRKQMLLSLQLIVHVHMLFDLQFHQQRPPGTTCVHYYHGGDKITGI